MLLMIEDGMREGVCHVMHSYAEANNKYMVRIKNLHFCNI